MNKDFSVRFVSDDSSMNWLQVNINFEKYKDYVLSIFDEFDNIYHANSIEHLWYNYTFGRVFKYDLKISLYGEDNVKTERMKFNINDHKFNIILISDNDQDIRIWKYYLWLIQIKYDVKFNIIENKKIDQIFEDYVEISRMAYDTYLKSSKKNNRRLFKS